MNKKIAPAAPVMDTKSLAAFPALGKATNEKVQMPAKLDYKKTVIVTPPTLAEIEKMAATSKAREVKPSSMIPTRCYDEFGEDYDGPDEWEMEREAEEFQLNAALPVGGRRGGF